MFIKKLLLCIMSLLIFISCEDLLEVSPTEQITSDAVWGDINLIEAHINQIYASMRSGLQNSPRLNILTDEATARGRDYVQSVVEGGLSPDNYQAIDYWSHYYDLIEKANSFLENVTGDRLEELQAANDYVVQRMTGEAKFFRAYSYFRLAAFYGGVPLITQTFQLDDDFNVERSSYNEIIEFVVSELDEAATLLPLEHTGDDLGRVTKGAAMAIKARALLYAASPLNNPDNDTEKWQRARDAAKEVIDLNLYSLYPNYKEMFLDKGNQEFIWVLNYNSNIAQRNRIEVTFYPNGSGGYAQIHPLHNTVQAFETMNGLLPEEDPDFDLQDPYVNRDPRFYDMILYDGAPFLGREIETFTPGGIDTEDGPEGWNATWTGYYYRKFIDESIPAPPTAHIPSSPQWPYVRYAEILLNYAEASYFLGDEETAKEYINMIRSRESVKMPPVTESGTELLKRLQNERRIELLLEEHRWFDVRRWKIADETDNIDAQRIDITRDPETGEKTYSVSTFQQRRFLPQHYLVPIPQSEIDRNPLLEQNPHY